MQRAGVKRRPEEGAALVWAGAGGELGEGHTGWVLRQSLFSLGQSPFSGSTLMNCSEKFEAGSWDIFRAFLLVTVHCAHYGYPYLQQNFRHRLAPPLRSCSFGSVAVPSPSLSLFASLSVSLCCEFLEARGPAAWFSAIWAIEAAQ